MELSEVKFHYYSLRELVNKVIASKDLKKELHLDADAKLPDLQYYVTKLVMDTEFDVFIFVQDGMHQVPFSQVILPSRPLGRNFQMHGSATIDGLIRTLNPARVLESTITLSYNVFPDAIVSNGNLIISGPAVCAMKTIDFEYQGE